jgi:hypothetical protein
MGKSEKVDLDKLRSVGTLRSGYKDSTKTTIKDSRGSKQVEHFDGRVDAVVRPKPVRIGANADYRKGDN